MQKGQKNDGAKLRHVHVVRGAWSSICPQPIQPDLRRVSRPPDPEPSASAHLASPNFHLCTGALRPAESRGPESALTDSRRKRRIETRRRLPGGRIVAATEAEGTAPDFLSCSIYQAINRIVARCGFVAVRKKTFNFRFILLVMLRMSDLTVSNATGTFTRDVFV